MVTGVSDLESADVALCLVNGDNDLVRWADKGGDANIGCFAGR
jgi:hypothetical protein